MNSADAEEGEEEDGDGGDGRGGRHTNSSGSLDHEEEANFWQQQEGMGNDDENGAEQDGMAVANEPIAKNPTNLDRDRWMYYDKCFPQRAHMASHDQTTIWVTGLDHNADTGLLYERFSQSGPVKRIALYREPTILAHVEFGNRLAAKHAIRANGNRIWHGMSLKCGWNAVVESFYAENGLVGNNQQMVPQPSLYRPPPMAIYPPVANFHPAPRNKSASTQSRNAIEPRPRFQPSKKYQESNSYARPPYVPPPNQNTPFNSLHQATSLAINEGTNRSGYFFNGAPNSEERPPLQCVQQNQSVRYERSQSRRPYQGRSISRKSNRYEEKPQRRNQRSPSPIEFDPYSTRSHRSRWDRERNRHRFRSFGGIPRNDIESPSPSPRPTRQYQQRMNRRSDYRHVDDEHGENRHRHQYGGQFRRGERAGNSAYGGGGRGMEGEGNRGGTYGGCGAEVDKIRFF